MQLHAPVLSSNTDLTSSPMSSAFYNPPPHPTPYPHSALQTSPVSSLNKPQRNHHSLDPSEILPNYKPHHVIQPSDDTSTSSESSNSYPTRKTSALRVVPDDGAYPIHTQQERQDLFTELPSRLDGVGPRGPASHPFHMSTTDSDGSSQSGFIDEQITPADHGVFDHGQYQDPPQRHGPGDEVPGSYDLKPPPPATALSNIEFLADRLFSIDHLKIIIRDSSALTRFHNFLQRYNPDLSPVLHRYVETQKALSAVEYANAVASTISKGSYAAAIDPEFEARTSDAVDTLVNHALPSYITHCLVQVVTETLVKEITGQNTPIMRELVAGLAEVYCLTDPSLPDNPIVYASEEFYKCTQYGRDYVIGRNCRFLQGPRSNPASVQRLVDALAEGHEICETILNYRRDGSPFINLLMIAPLYDNKGEVRYFIGAQIDINGLIEGGRGLDSFERLLARDRADQRYGGHHPAGPENSRSANTVLSELAAMWSGDEVDIARRITRQSSASETSGHVSNGHRSARRFLGMDDPAERNMWPERSLGGSGRLPGVFQNYLLVRPFPSLRITFTSPALRIPGLLQSKFLDHIGGPAHIRDGILSALSSGIGVTAKVTWLPISGAGSQTIQAPADPLASTSASTSASITPSRPHSKHHHVGPHRPPAGSKNTDELGKTRWIHCTPLLGSDEKVGVWMIVMVESERITGALNAHARAADANAAATRELRRETSTGGEGTGSRLRADLYARYMRAEGRYASLSRMAGAGGPTESGKPIHDTGAMAGANDGVVDGTRLNSDNEIHKSAFGNLTASAQARRERELERSRERKQLRAKTLADKAVDDQFKDF